MSEWMKLGVRRPQYGVLVQLRDGRRRTLGDFESGRFWVDAYGVKEIAFGDEEWRYPEPASEDYSDRATPPLSAMTLESIDPGVVGGHGWNNGFAGPDVSKEMYKRVGESLRREWPVDGLRPATAVEPRTKPEPKVVRETHELPHGFEAKSDVYVHDGNPDMVGLSTVDVRHPDWSGSLHDAKIHKRLGGACDTDAAAVWVRETVERFRKALGG